MARVALSVRPAMNRALRTPIIHATIKMMTG